MSASENQAWRNASAKLTAWADARLVNRTDAWGSYRHGRRGLKATSYTGAGTLGSRDLEHHFQGVPGCILGLHAINPDGNTCQWVAVDIDAHSDADDPVVNERAAWAWYDEMETLGFRPLLFDSNGAGGFHLWILFAEPIPSDTAYRFASWIVRKHRDRGFSKPPETFPKQRALDDRVRFGNWLRLPGRHHTRGHWTKVWNGSEWLADQAAISEILSRTGDSPELIPDAARTYERPRAVVPQIAACAPPDLTETAKAKQAKAYVEKVPGAVSGQRGHDVTFRVACVLVHGFDLSESDAWSLLCQWNETCEPPWDEYELRHKLTDAQQVTDPRGRGYLLSRWESSVRIERVDTADGETDLDTWRAELQELRIASANRIGCYLDRGPTGSGKSTADFAAMERSPTGLFIVPGHSNAHEVFVDSLGTTITACPFPKRSTEAIVRPCVHCDRQPGGCVVCDGEGTFVTDANCRNPDANAAEQQGFSVLTAVCRGCRDREWCENEGYVGQVQRCMDAKQTPHRVATHQRAAHRGLRDLATGTGVVTIHEDAVDVFRPSANVPEADVRAFLSVVDCALSSPVLLDRVATIDAKTPGCDRNGIRDWLCHAANETETLLKLVAATTEPRRLTPLPVCRKPWLLDVVLREALAESRQQCPFISALSGYVSGEWDTMAVLIDTPRSQGGKRRRERSVSFVRKNPVPDHCTVWLCDSTMDRDAIAAIVGVPVVDQTPTGVLPYQARGVQWPIEVTRATSPRKVRSIVRGCLAQFPECRRAGLITHRPHLSAIAKLDEPFAGRIAKVSYYGSKEDRASNAWHKECDLLIVLGTPRVPKVAIQHRLFSTREDDAFALESAWGQVLRELDAEDGGTVEVLGYGFVDEAWRRTANAVVEANLRQAVGRARLVTPQAIPCVAVTTEDSGLPVLREDWPTIADAEAMLIKRMISLNSIERERALRSDSIATSAAQKLRVTQKHLASLEAAGVVRRITPRGGWSVADAWRPTEGSVA